MSADAQVLESVVVPSVGEATVFRPTGTPKAVFVALHGIQSNRTWYEPLGRELAKRGFALWAYTRPNAVLKPGGNPVADAATWEEWLTQLEAIAQKARVQSCPLIAMGVSWGARPVLASVALHPSIWSGVVVLNPALKTRKDFNFLIAAFLSGAPFSRLGTFNIPLTSDDYTFNQHTRNVWLADEKLTKRCTNRFLGRTVALRGEADQKLRNLSKPVLALLGRRDNLVPHDAMDRRLKNAENPGITIETIDSGTHCMLVEQPSELANRIEEWTRHSAEANYLKQKPRIGSEAQHR